MTDSRLGLISIIILASVHILLSHKRFLGTQLWYVKRNRWKPFISIEDQSAEEAKWLAAVRGICSSHEMRTHRKYADYTLISKGSRESNHSIW